MPSEPRIPSEPTLEELSAYLDRELDAATQARVADHVAGCAECTRRLDGLRETVHAVRALPMETPNRTFTIPAQRRQSFRWAPVGWIGGVAAALLIIVVGVTQMHGPAGSTAFTSGGAPGQKAAAPAASQGLNTLDSRSGGASQAYNANTNTVTVVDPINNARSLSLSTDAKSYSASGTMTVRVRFTGLPSDRTVIVGLLLERNGYAVQLWTGSGPSDSSGFEATYQFSNLDLSTPVAGSYTLIAIEQLPGAVSRDDLVARLPVTITP